MSLTIINTYLLICGIHGVIQSFILFRAGRVDQRCNRFLSFYIFSFSVILIDSSLKIMDSEFQLPNFTSIPFLFSGFSLFLYAKNYVEEQESRKELIFHSLPMLSAILLFFINYLSQKVSFLPVIFSQNPVVNNIVMNLSGGLHMIVYLSLTVRILGKDGFSKPEMKSKLSWLRFLISTSLIVCLAVLTLVCFTIILRENFDIRWAYIVWTVMSILIYGIGYAALQKPAVFLPMGQVLSNISGTITKYRNTNVSKDMVKSTVHKIEILMEEEQLYKQPSLTLQKFASDLGISPNVLSRIINEHYKLNYNQLLNEYRLEEVKKKISDPAFDKYTILGIAMEAGFNSKSSFNEFFRKRMNMSPNEYKMGIKKASH